MTTFTKGDVVKDTAAHRKTPLMEVTKVAGWKVSGRDSGGQKWDGHVNSFRLATDEERTQFLADKAEGKVVGLVSYQ